MMMNEKPCVPNSRPEDEGNKKLPEKPLTGPDKTKKPAFSTGPRG